MNYVIVPDTHFGNNKLEECRFKGFSERVLKNITHSVPENGVLVHIGDVCFGDDALWHSKITGLPLRPFKRKVLVRGNHDGKTDNWYMSHGWDFVCESFTIERFNKRILFSHMPLRDSGYDINVHGHFHDFKKEIIQTREPRIFALLNEKHYLVALEKTNYMPVRLEYIVDDFLGGNNTLKGLV
jgi:calcineurin-like phosphoesterase family protein